MRSSGRCYGHLVAQGFTCIVIWRGCGQHDLAQVVDEFNEEQRDAARCHLPELPYHDILMRLGNAANPRGHADAFGAGH